MLHDELDGQLSEVEADDFMGEEDEFDDEAITPCVNLSDVFDQLADRPVLPASSHSLSSSTGWSFDDLGGGGLC